MLFNSYEFIFAFLPVAFIIYFFLNRKRLIIAAKSWLVFCSLFFYSWWNVSYLSLILCSMIFNYAVGSALTKDNPRQKISRKSILIVGIVFNLALLGYFKYVDFFISNINFIIPDTFNQLNIVLPLAISFFTFQQIAYLVDSYKSKAKEYDFINYAIFVTFFPQLIAGPIVHHKEMMPQFEAVKNKVLNYKNISAGLFIFVIGLFKKIVIADTFAVYATQGFDYSITLDFIEAWITSLSYAYQLYFDFSGYTDMAIGGALLFNIKLPINFFSPYKALNIQDFWRRWHITLSRFLRDYVYIPLGGNRYGELNTCKNLMFTFLIGGLWHGAGWTFVLWGFLHGLALVIHRLWTKTKIRLPVVISWYLTFNFVVITWVFFRAKDWADAIKVLKGMFGFNGIILPSIIKNKISILAESGFNFGVMLSNLNITPSWYLFVFSIIVISFFIVVFAKNSMEMLEEFKPDTKTLIFVCILVTIAIIHLNKVSEFLYFQF